MLSSNIVRAIITAAALVAASTTAEATDLTARACGCSGRQQPVTDTLAGA